MRLRLIHIQFLLGILLFLSTSMVNAQSKSEIWIQVGSNVPSDAPYNLVFGNHVNGTYGIDKTLGEKEPPPPPPGLFSIWKAPRTGIPNYPAAGLLTYDYRAYTGSAQKDTFKLYFNQAEQSSADIIITWPNAAYLGAHCTAMKIKIGADVYDMFTQSTVTIPGAGDLGISFAMIYKTGVTLVEFDKQNPPALLSPANNATNVSITPWLQWNHVASGVVNTYQIQVATDAAFTNIVKDSSMVDSAWHVGPLLNCTNYYWRGKTTNANGVSAWSTAWTFKTIAIKPAAPALVSPTDNAAGVILTPTLSWSAGDNCTDSYHLQVAKDAGFTNGVMNTWTTQTSQVLSTLEQGTFYYWHVKAINSVDSSSYSASRNFQTVVLTPPTPQMVSPVNGDSTLDPIVQLKWRTNSNTNFYHVQLATDQNFTSLIINDSTLTDTFKTTISLTNCQKYYWHVQAKNAVGLSLYSTTWNFKIKPATPLQPVLVNPVDNATGVSLTPTLSWTAGDICSYSYRLQVAKDSFFTTVVWNEYLALTSRQLTTLEEETDYYWRVKSINPTDSSQFTAYRKFKTLVNPPIAPQLSSPGNGASDIDTSVTVRWRITPHTDFYHLQLAMDPTFTSLIIDDSTLTDTFKIATPLTNCRKYYWHVRGKNVSGTGIFSSTWNFQIKPIAPAPPVLSSPADNATGVSLTPNLSWTAGDICSYNYRLQVAKDPTFTTIVADVYTSQTSQTLSTLETETFYYWHVKSLNPVDSSQYTAYRIFKTLIQPPGMPLLVSPANGDTNQIPTGAFVWNLNPHTDFYHLQIATDQSFTPSSLVVNDSTIVDTSYVPSPLTNCRLYYWHLQAKNAAGVSSYTAARSFKIKPGTPLQPALVSPADNATNVSLTPTLSWTGSDICSYSYHLQVAKDAGFTNLVVNTWTTQTSRTLSTLELNTDYYWHVKSLNPVDSSQYSAYRTFKTFQQKPPTPTLSSPVSGDTNQAPTGDLVWNPALYTEFYHLQVATDQNFTQSSLVVNDSTLTGVSYTPSALTNCKFYYWHVSAKNGAGKSDFSSTWSFKVRTAVPGVPNLLSPYNTQDSLSEMVRLIWNKADICTQRYFYHVSHSSSFTDTVAIGQITDTTVVIGPILGNVYFYWHVQAVNYLGSGSFSPTYMFHTTISRPLVPVLLAPADGATDLQSALSLQWDSAAFAKTYHVQLALDQAFTNLKLNDSTIARQGGIRPSRALTGLLNSTTYFWRVRAKNEIGISNWSPIWRFTTLFPPAAPTLNLPANDAYDVSITPQFDWSQAQRADIYRLQVAQDTVFSSLVFDDSTISILGWQITNPLKSLGKYYWRVRGKNNVGWGPWSSIYHFTTTRTGVANWLIPLTIGETGPAFATIYFGVNPNATAGIDPSLGEYALPPIDPWYFDARFISPFIGEGLLVDIVKFKNYAQVDTFQFSFQPEASLGSYPMKISWPISLVKSICDSMVIKDQLVSSSVYTRMDRDSFVTITNTSMRSLYIVKYGTFPLPVDVKPTPIDLPKGFVLYQNYPNPFNPSTNLTFSTDKTAKIQINVYDILGREVAVITRSIYTSMEWERCIGKCNAKWCLLYTHDCIWYFGWQ
jgi:hypothetical protein